MYGIEMYPSRVRVAVGGLIVLSFCDSFVNFCQSFVHSVNEITTHERVYGRRPNMAGLGKE